MLLKDITLTADIGVLQDKYYICSSLPNTIIYKKTGGDKDHKFKDPETINELVSEYNFWTTGSSFIFPKGSDVNPARECMLFVRVANLLRDAGMSGDEVEKYMYFLGNRACITCKPEVLRADVVKGEFQCSNCRGCRTPPSPVDTVRKHAVEWLSNTPDMWCQNLKPKMD